MALLLKVAVSLGRDWQPTAAGIGVLLHHLIHMLDRQQLRPRSWMARLAAVLAATALAPLWWLKPKPVTGGLLE